MIEEEMDAPSTDLTEEQCDQAYGEGYNACHDSKSLLTNPYEKDSPLWHEWKRGWQHYDADYNPLYYEH